MGDQRYLLPAPPRPWYQRVSADRWLSLAAIAGSLAAAIFTGWYAWDTHGMRIDAQGASKKQATDVRAALEAAQTSAHAATILAESMKSSVELTKQSVIAYQELVKTQQKQLATSERMFMIDQRPRVSTTITLSEEANVNDQKPVTVIVDVKGTGKTPGRDGQVRISGIFSEKTKLSYPPEFLYPALMDFSKEAELKVTMKVAAPLPKSALSGKLRLYVYGIVTFHDEINPGTTYSENFCGFYPVLVSGVVENFAHGCSEGNLEQVNK